MGNPGRIRDVEEERNWGIFNPLYTGHSCSGYVWLVTLSLSGQVTQAGFRAYFLPDSSTLGEIEASCIVDLWVTILPHLT